MSHVFVLSSDHQPLDPCHPARARQLLTTGKMENPEIGGVAYQQGTLAGYEVREYLLNMWERRCVYCGATDTPLQVEHIVPRPGAEVTG